MKKGISYFRVSTDSQNTEAQKEAVNKYAAYNRIDILMEFDDTISGASAGEERTEFNKMLKYVQSNTIDSLIVYELSRLGRNTGDVLKNIDYFHKKNIKVHVVDSNMCFAPNDEHSYLVLTMMSAVAKLERSITRSRTINGRDLKIKKGEWHGGLMIPYGYQVDNKHLIINHKEAEIVKTIFEMYSNNTGTTTICKYLNDNKIPTRFQTLGKKGHTQKLKKNNRVIDSVIRWRESVVLDMLKNTIYQGNQTIKFGLLSVPAIIDNYLFDKVQIILNEKKNVGIQTKHFYLLQNIPLICGCCGQRFTPKIKNTGLKVYMCNSKANKASCGEHGIKVKKIESVLWWLLSNTQLMNELFNDNKKEDEINKQLKIISEQLIDAEKHLKRVLNNEKQLIDLLIDCEEENRFFLNEKREFNNSQKKEIKKEIIDLQKKQIDYNELLNNSLTHNEMLEQAMKDPMLMSVYLDKVINKVFLTDCLIDDDKLTKNNNYKHLQVYIKGFEEPINSVIASRQDIIYPLGYEFKDKKIINYQHNRWLSMTEKNQIVNYPVMAGVKINISENDNLNKWLSMTEEEMLKYPRKEEVSNDITFKQLNEFFDLTEKMKKK